MDLNYDEVFKIYLSAMRLSGMLPNTKRDMKWLLCFLLKHGLVTSTFLLIMYNVIFINLKDRDFSETCKNGTLAIVFFETAFMHSILFWKEKCLLSLMDSIKKDYALAKQMAVEEKEIIQDYARKGFNVYKLWVVIGCLGLGAFPFVNVVLILYYWIIGKFRLIPLYYLVYPSFIENKKDNLVVFLLTYIILLIYGTVCSIMIVAFVPLGPAFILHACAQLDVAKLRIERLFRTDNIDEVREGVHAMVKHLQYIYGFVDRINLCFRIAYEVTFKFTTIMLPISCFEVLESLKCREFSLEFIMFVFGGVMLNTTLCFYSDLLFEKGEEFRQAVYLCGWERVYDPGVRSTLRLVLLRAERPVAVRSLFRIVCLLVLTDLADQSFKILNLMNAVWN